MRSAKHIPLGQSLIESVVTLGVVILLVTGLVIGATSSLRYAQDSRARSIATQYATEGLELARRERDSGWFGFARSQDVCVGPSGAIPTDPCELLDGRFTRKLLYTTDDALETVVVQSTVSWIEGGTTKSVVLQTTFTDWK